MCYSLLMGRPRKHSQSPPSSLPAHFEAPSDSPGGPLISEEHEVDPLLDKAFKPLPMPKVLVDQKDSPDEALRQAIWKQIKQMGLADAVQDEHTGGANLAVHKPDDMEELDSSRLARLVYSLSYVRLLELAARPTKNFNQAMEVGKLLMAYVRHVETNDRDVLKLDARNVRDKHLDEALAQMTTEVMRIATTYKVNPKLVRAAHQVESRVEIPSDAQSE